jgi:hypothetical protein
MIRFALLLALFVCQSAAAEQLVREFRGKDSTTTSDFTVDGPWLLDWWLDGEYSAQLVALEVWLIDATTGRIVGRVLYEKERGDGLKLFETPGTYRFRISGTLAEWRIRIKQLTPEEAEGYLPDQRRGPRLP